MVKTLIRKVFNARGQSIVPNSELEREVADIPDGSRRIFEEVRPYTMTSLVRVSSLVDASRYICSANITGAVVECGVWRGGSIMAVARTILDAQVPPRDLFLFDTFEGMPAAGSVDVDYQGKKASLLLDQAQRLRQEEKLTSGLLAYSPLEHVRANVARVGYPDDKIHFVKGRVEDTIPESAPEKIALLRLDTDWYESTKHELVHLYPRISIGGIVILDDYGYWQGARKATDEYFRENGLHVFLHRIDHSGRILIKA